MENKTIDTNVTHDESEETPPARMENGEKMDLSELVEESLKSIQEGEVVEGSIIQITKEYVMVDVGYKSEGQIPIAEFQNEKGEVLACEGDVIEVFLESWENEYGELILSREKAAKIKIWDEIRKAHNEGVPMKGVIVSRVKGGFTVDIGVPAFLPGSQVDLRPVKDMDSMLGLTTDFRVLKYNRKRSNVVVSRRALLEELRDRQRKETLGRIQEETSLSGVVKNITDYGAFIDLGGLDGLLHITDMSWGRIKHPSDLLKLGDEVTVKVLNFDPKTERVSLGLKQLSPDPWVSVSERYPSGAKVKGKVVSLTDYGAFVEIEEGIEGLIHISEMSWTRKVRHPSQILSIGDEVEAAILDVDTYKKRVSLGLKQVSPNPWDVISEKYPVGTIIEGRIKSVTDFGIFIGIDEGIDGLVHISDLSWSQKVKHPGEMFRKGQTVQAKVLKIDKENERFSLSVKHVTPDPWERIASEYQSGGKVTGAVTNVTDFGIFVELMEGVEGLVHVSEISKEKIKTPVGMFHPGEEIEAQILNINKKDHKIALSLKRLEADADKRIVNEYISSENRPFSSLGDIFKENLENKARQMEEESTD